VAYLSSIKQSAKHPKHKVHPRTGYEDPDGEERYSSTLSLTSALDRGGWSTPHTPDPKHIHKEKSDKMQQCIKIFIIRYLHEAQHVSGDTPPIIVSLKLHWQPLVFYTWKVVGRVVGGRCQA